MVIFEEKKGKKLQRNDNGGQRDDGDKGEIVQVTCAKVKVKEKIDKKENQIYIINLKLHNFNLLNKLESSQVNGWLASRVKPNPI